MKTHKLTVLGGHLTLVSYDMDTDTLLIKVKEQGIEIIHSYTEESKLQEACYAKLAGLKEGQFIQV